MPTSELVSCIDCGSTTRKLTRPGPRCATCKRAKRTRDRDRARDARYRKIYGISLAVYNRLFKFQGERCAGCLRATGKTKNLAVDHDHALGSGEHTVRGLLCGPCNSVLAHARDDPEYFARMIDYLSDPPYRRMKRTEDENAN